MIWLLVASLGAMGQAKGGDLQETQSYTAPASNRLEFNLNLDWKFIREDVNGAQNVEFDDSRWAGVSLPHTYNDTDSFREWRSHNAKNGPSDTPRQERLYTGLSWYRKRFVLEPAWSGRKIFLEFEGVRNTARFFVNGKEIGKHSNQIGPCGLDISEAVKFGSENVLAVQVDGNYLAKDPAGFSYGWSSVAFYPMFGGIPRSVHLHVADKLYQTLPLYSNLKTSGVYVYAQKIDTQNRTAELSVEAEIANEYTQPKNAIFEFWVIDRDGKEVLRSVPRTQSLAAGTKTICIAQATMKNIHLWSPDFPYLYRVCSAISVDGKLLDVVQSPLGVRRASFSAKDGLKLNGHPIYLKGYAPRTTMEWAVTGIPRDWMLEYDYQLMRENHANFIRPMHVAPRKNQVESADKFGIIYACPAGNGEGDDPETPQGRARWQDRLEVMRDVTIYFRNHPSILFYEASNSGITAQHMADMVKVRDQWDPHGGRFAGTRSADKNTLSIKEYQSPMDNPGASPVLPTWDAEYARAEAPRRVWDKFTPFLDYAGKSVTGGYLTIATPVHVQATKAGTGDGIYDYPQDAFRLASTEDLALNNTLKYFDRFKQSVFVLPESERSNKGIMVGGAKIIFADSNSHGRMYDMEVARVSGVLDAVRLPKESYYAMQVAHNPQPQVHILGHWNYPAGTVKTVWVISNTAKVKLATFDESGKLLRDFGAGTRHVVNERYNRVNQYAFFFKDIPFAPGKIEAVGYDNDIETARTSKLTAGAPARLVLTPLTGPGAFVADGADIAMIDVEVVDAAGRRCPIEQSRIDFEPSGAGTFLGGYNSGVQYSTHQNHLNTECGINRVFVRSTRQAGEFSLVAKRAGLAPVSITLKSIAPTSAGGLSTQWPRRYEVTLGTEPAVARDDAPLLVRSAAGTGAGDSLLREFAYTGTKGQTLNPPLPDAHIESAVRNGSRVYVDRDWQFADLPAYLTGSDYVQAFARDATEGTSTDTIQFYTNQPCRIYIAIDSANAMPKHNNNEDYQWAKQPETLTINGRKMTIYKSKPLDEGYNGYFAANGFGIANTQGANQYVVFAVAEKSK